jgi:two-component system, sensor histidine kinase LadS
MSFTSFISDCKRALLACAVVLGSLHYGLATAQIPAQPTTPAVKVVSITTFITSPQTGIDATQAVPSAQWKAFEPEKTYPLGLDNIMWMQLKLAVSAPAMGWTVKVPKPYIDRVELHTPGDDGAWLVQSAGDKIANSQWAVPGLHPTFKLPVLNAGEHTVFLKVTANVPTNFQIVVANEQDSLSNNLDHLTRSGAVMIFVMCMAFMSIFLALVYRDSAYAAYSVWAALAALTVAAYTGLGNYLLWPNTTSWPEISIHITLLLSIVAQMVFCYVCFQPHKLWAPFTALTWTTVGITLATIAILVLSTASLTVYSITFISALIINWVVIVSMVGARLRRGELSAKLWMLAYIPLGALIIGSALDHFGLTPGALLGYYWPLYALSFEVPVLLLALMLRAQARHTQTVTKNTLQQLDPLTGFIAPSAYESVASPMWESAASQEQDFAAIYLQITQPGLPFLGGQSHAVDDERIVRVLRTVFRMEDTFAQVSSSVYAVLMPGKTLGEPLQQRLTRVVAQLRMLSLELHAAYPLQTRVVACTIHSLPMQWPDVHRILLSKFDENEEWGKRTIRIVSKRHSQRGDEADLSNFWARALDAEAQFDRSSKP